MAELTILLSKSSVCSSVKVVTDRENTLSKNSTLESKLRVVLDKKVGRLPNRKFIEPIGIESNPS